MLLKVGSLVLGGGEFSWGGHVAFAQFPFSRKPVEAFGWEPPLKKSPFHLVHPWLTGTKLQARSWFLLQLITLQHRESLSQLLARACGSQQVPSNFILGSYFLPLVFHPCR